MRLFGVTIPDNKRLEIGLTAIYGIGRSRAHKILKKAKVSFAKKAGEVKTDEESIIRHIAEIYKLEGDLKREVSGNIKRLKDIKTYRGNRHSQSLPVRGQRTKTNSRTRRGNVRKTMASGKRTVDKK